MKKLLILQNLILPYRKPVYNGLARDYDVTILHSGTPTVEPEDTYKEILVPVRRLGPFFIQNGVFRKISSGKYDAIIAMFDLRWPAYILPVFRSRRRYGKWIFWGIGYSRRHAVNYVRDWLMKKSDAILLYGRRNIDEMIRRGACKNKIFVAHNTIHIPNHRDYSMHPKSSLLFVGTFRKHKSIDLLIEVFARIREKIPENVHLEIVGDYSEVEFSHLLGLGYGKDRKFLHKEVKKFGLEDRVVFHGRLDQHDLLAEIFSRAYAYVALGNVGLSVLHSFAYGVPVIAEDRPEIHGPEFDNLKHQVNGLTYKKEDELEEALIEICNFPQLAATLGQNAYNLYYKERTLETMLDGFKKAIED